MAMLREASRDVGRTHPRFHTVALTANRALGALAETAALLEGEPLASDLAVAIQDLAERLATAARHWALAVDDAGRIGPGPMTEARDFQATRACLANLDIVERLCRPGSSVPVDEFRLIMLAFRHADDFVQLERLTALAAQGRAAAATLARAGRRLRRDILQAG
jgi:hypothetical protein